MERPWSKDVEAVCRDGATFAWHRCLDCLKLIRWEEDRCYSCHQGAVKQLARELMAFERDLDPEWFARRVREVKAAWGLSNRSLAAMFNCRQSAIAKITESEL